MPQEFAHLKDNSRVISPQILGGGKRGELSGENKGGKAVEKKHRPLENISQAGRKEPYAMINEGNFTTTINNKRFKKDMCSS